MRVQVILYKVTSLAPGKSVNHDRLIKAMSNSRFTHVLLSVITVALTIIAVRPYLQLQPVQAQASSNDPIYVEPGVFMLRIPEGGQVLGRVAINLRTGNVWGFPTSSSDPYPTSPLDGKPQVSHAVALGKFALSEAR